jgi:50S ribosomal protein L16 3-hydroxylase
MLDMSPRAFLRSHWQKRPLFVRAALAQLSHQWHAVSDARALIALAARDDVESRIVERRGRRWHTQHGPFEAIKVNKNNWSLLVSGVNLHVPAADALLRRFAFVPQARLDDVMVSYATPGGGVGPHVDSYDVFLVQGAGRRRWRVWSPGGSTPRHYIADPGDLLYLPPGWRHDGVAVTPCFTCSIGFRAPRGRELAAAFLDWLHERGLPDAGYRDPGLRPAARPALIPKEMLRYCAQVLSKIRWSARDVEGFLGEYLSTPKPHVVFKGARQGARLPLAKARVRLDPKTQLLYAGRRFFLNGETLELAGREAQALRELADRRTIDGGRFAGSALATQVLEWHRSGYLHLQEEA